MDERELFQILLDHQNPERAVRMKEYLRNQFDFLGIYAGERRQLSAPFMKAVRKEPAIRWGFLHDCWNMPYRECQYVGCDYLILKKDTFTPADVPAIKELALTKSWWDTVDVIDKVIGHIALSHPEVNDTLIAWSTTDNIWLRRIAIDHQRLRKEQTNEELLETILVNNLGDKEFFINKAIGWSLGDYSKTKPEWVKSFLERHQEEMASLSIREASKYL